MSAVKQPHVGPRRTNLLQSVPILVSECDAVVLERPSVHLGRAGKVNEIGGGKQKSRTKAVLRSGRCLSSGSGAGAGSLLESPLSM